MIGLCILYVEQYVKCSSVPILKYLESLSLACIISFYQSLLKILICRNIMQNQSVFKGLNSFALLVLIFHINCHMQICSVHQMIPNSFPFLVLNSCSNHHVQIILYPCALPAQYCSVTKFRSNHRPQTWSPNTVQVPKYQTPTIQSISSNHYFCVGTCH